MTAIRIQVGAAADRNLGRVFDPLIEASRRARAVVAADLAGITAATQSGAGAGARAQGVEANRAARATVASYAEVESAASRSAARQVAHARGAARARVQTAEEAQRELRRIADRENAEFERQLFRDVAAHERAENQKGRIAGRRLERSGRRIANDTTHTAWGAGRRAYGFGRDIARGAGVVDLGALVRQDVELEKVATDVTTSAFAARGQVAGAGDVQSTLGAIHSAGDQTKLSYGKLGEGLLQFVAKSADLETGKKVLADLGDVARATGTDVDDLVSSAGDVNKMLDATPDRAERLLTIMRLIAKQGAMGNVEVRDLAMYMGRITAGAFRYEGGSDKNIGILGALAQVAMRGGAIDAAEATNSAAAFARDITKSASLGRFAKAGIDVFADEGKTLLRSPEALIVEVLSKTKGNQAEIANLFKNDASKKAVQGFATIYKEAGGGDAGLRQVHEAFAKFSETLTASQVTQAAALSKDSKEARIQSFNNNMEKAAASLAERLLPALERSAPAFERLIVSLGDVAGFAVEHPGTAVVAALVASLGKAAIGEGVREAITQAVAGRGGKGIGVLGGLGAAGLVLASATIAIEAANIAVKRARGEGTEAEDSDIGSTQSTVNQALTAFGQTGTLSAGTQEALEKRLALVRQQIANAGRHDPEQSVISGYLESLGSYVGLGRDATQRGRDQEDARSLSSLQLQERDISKLLDAVKDSGKPQGVQRVEVINMPSTGGPGVDPSGRSDGGEDLTSHE